jgi:hypothetical protein
MLEKRWADWFSLRWVVVENAAAVACTLHFLALGLSVSFCDVTFCNWLLSIPPYSHHPELVSVCGALLFGA